MRSNYPNKELKPVNKQASLVFAKGDNYEHSASKLMTEFDTPPPIKHLKKPGIKYRIIGQAHGKITLVGYFGRLKKGDYWVGRCVCGKYVLRHGRKWRRGLSSKDACQACRILAKLTNS